MLRQVLHESTVLLRHSEVAHVFRFFSGSSLVSKGFLCATAFFPLSSPELPPASSSTTHLKLCKQNQVKVNQDVCKLLATDARHADISEENPAIDQCQINNCKTSECATFCWQLLQSIS